MRRLPWMSPAGALLLAACTAAPAPVPPPSPSVPAPLAATTQRAAGRDCASRVSVGLSDAAWRAAPAAGPATFAPLDYAWGDRAGFADRAPDAQGWRWFKVAMRLRGGTAATVTIPAVQRDVAALTYRNGLDDTVTFAACGDGPDAAPAVEFAGGFALRAALCLTVEVSSGDRTDRVVLDFGKGGC